MKKLLLVCAILALTGCANTMTAKVTMTWPSTPPDLQTACPDLGQVDPNTIKLSDALNTVTSNYTQYYICKDRVDNWIDWYNTQQKIYNSVK